MYFFLLLLSLIYLFKKKKLFTKFKKKIEIKTEKQIFDKI